MNELAVSGSSSASLRRHIESTYLSLRLGIAAIGVALPLALWIGGLGVEGVPLLGSMSAYYYTSMRDVFVGALWAVGVALYLYRGFSRAEHVALSVAGVLAVCVALFPTAPAGAEPTIANNVHGISAVLFFLCLAYVSVFRASDTLSLVRDTGRARSLQRLYRLLGVAMLISPLVALAIAWLVRPPAGEPSAIFFVEAFGVSAFAAYWVVKSLELRQTSAESAAARGILEAAPKPPRGRAVPGKLIQVAPLDESVDEVKQQMAAESAGKRGTEEG